LLKDAAVVDILRRIAKQDDKDRFEKMLGQYGTKKNDIF
jgi:hypothetical protein